MCIRDSPRSEPTFLSFLVPNNTTTIINISSIDHGDIPLNICAPHLSLDFFSSKPETPNLLLSSSRISLTCISFKVNDTKL